MASIEIHGPREEQIDFFIVSSKLKSIAVDIKSKRISLLSPNINARMAQMCQDLRTLS